MKTYIVTDNRPTRRHRTSPGQIIPESSFIDHLIHTSTDSVWFIPQTKLLERLFEHSDERLYRNQLKVRKYSLIFLMEEISSRLHLILKSFFKEVITVTPGSMLSFEEINEVRTHQSPQNFVIGGQVDRASKTVTIVRGDLSRLVVPFSMFPRSGTGIEPNFAKFALEDHGQTLKFGSYEAAVDAVLYELDPLYRRERKKRLLSEDKSFGSCLKRLRLQKGLKQTDFPEVDPREIGRIERGEVRKPRSSTLQHIAHRLGVEPREIETF